METQISDALPLAALTIGQARHFIRGLVSQELEALKPQQPPQTLHDKMNAADAVRYLETLGYFIKLPSLYNLVAAGDIPCSKIGKRLVFSRERLAVWMQCKFDGEVSTSPALTLAKSAGRKK